MAGNDHCQRIGREGLRHRPHGFGRADAPRDFGVGRGFTSRGFLQRLPNTFLKGRPAHIQRHPKAASWVVDECHDLSDTFFKPLIARTEPSLRKPGLQIKHERVGIPTL